MEPEEDSVPPAYLWVENLFSSTDLLEGFMGVSLEEKHGRGLNFCFARFTADLPHFIAEEVVELLDIFTCSSEMHVKHLYIAFNSSTRPLSVVELSDLFPKLLPDLVCSHDRIIRSGNPRLK